MAREAGEAAEFEAVQFVDPDPRNASDGLDTVETVIGVFGTEREAIETARRAWKAFKAAERSEVAWWLVRVPGETLARWLADSRSDYERVVDLRTGRLIDMR
jgi:hypothetical protein